MYLLMYFFDFGNFNTSYCTKMKKLIPWINWEKDQTRERQDQENKKKEKKKEKKL